MILMKRPQKKNMKCHLNQYNYWMGTTHLSYPLEKMGNAQQSSYGHATSFELEKEVQEKLVLP